MADKRPPNTAPRNDAEPSPTAASGPSEQMALWKP
jgi:hypothetical protein